METLLDALRRVEEEDIIRLKKEIGKLKRKNTGKKITTFLNCLKINPNYVQEL